MQFTCRYGTSEGHVLTQIEAGSDAMSVRRALERRGLHIFEIRARGLPIKFSLPFPQGKIPDDQFMAFNQELAALLRAGLPLLQSLELILKRMQHPKLRAVLGEVRDRISSGEELSQAFASFGELFPPLYPAILRAGEISGELEQVLRRFIRYQKLMITTRKRVVSALVYPAVLVLLSTLVLMILSLYVVPSFAQFFDDLKAELPPMTKVTLGVSYWLRDHFTWLIVGGLAAVVAYKVWNGTAAGRLVIDRWRLRLPILGQVFHQFSLSEFCRSMSILLAGGLPLVSAFEIAIGAMSNTFLRESTRFAIDRVRGGQSFHEALEKTAVFPEMAMSMIEVGEATASLDEMLGSVSDYFDDRVETRMQRFLTLVEPILLVVMGGMIAFILISVYLPMFSAFSQVG
jgi:type IV pilus assembly protein PilC